jgi:2-oxoglutarate ferredoxin oxidoreductase subunit alpha
MKSVYEPLTWLVGGEAGYGITTMGQMFARACSRAGLNVFGYVEYPSLIRGGHNIAMVRVGTETVHAHSDKIDIMLALNKETVDLHSTEMAEGGVIIYDGETVVLDAEKCAGLRLISVPLARITKELGAERVMRNTVALGASFAIVGMGFGPVENVLQSTFERKGPEVVAHNIGVAKAGFDFVMENYKEPFAKTLAAVPGAPKRMVISGNEAIALGALKAGVKFMAAYPMTPVTSIMQIIAKYGVKHKIVMKHSEDEIAAINMAIGAAHMGVRSMTATAGGGFSLMAEALGMAGITETPLVVVEGMRPGPSTGLPTWTDQADLRFLMHASQGEFPRVIFLPGDMKECFEMTLKAFNTAEKYQMICMLLTDKYLGESVQSVELFMQDYTVDRGARVSMEEAAAMKQGDYKRFEFTESGVSKRAVPGMPNTIYAVSTDEHKEDGDLDEGSENRIKMVDKRARKLETLRKEYLSAVEMCELHGPADAELTLVGWGSTKGPILEAMGVANENGLKVNFLQIKMVLPFPTEAVAAILGAAKKRVLVENNSEGQMGGVIRQYTGIEITDRLLRYDGRPLHPAEILAKIHDTLNA